MSVFLIYFERADPAASWKAFQQTSPCIIESFDQSRVGESLLRIETGTAMIDGHVRAVHIIHDGSSFRTGDVLETADQRIQAVRERQAHMSNFFMERLSTGKVLPQFILHLYHGAVAGPEPEVVTTVAAIDMSYTDLPLPAGSLQQEIKYTIQHGLISPADKIPVLESEDDALYFDHIPAYNIYSMSEPAAAGIWMRYLHTRHNSFFQLPDGHWLTTQHTVIGRWREEDGAIQESATVTALLQSNMGWPAGRTVYYCRNSVSMLEASWADVTTYWQRFLGWEDDGAIILAANSYQEAILFTQLGEIWVVR